MLYIRTKPSWSDLIHTLKQLFSRKAPRSGGITCKSCLKPTSDLNSDPISCLSRILLVFLPHKQRYSKGIFVKQALFLTALLFSFTASANTELLSLDPQKTCQRALVAANGGDTDADFYQCQKVVQKNKFSEDAALLCLNLFVYTDSYVQLSDIVKCLQTVANKSYSKSHIRLCQQKAVLGYGTAGDVTKCLKGEN